MVRAWPFATSSPCNCWSRRALSAIVQRPPALKTLRSSLNQAAGSAVFSMLTMKDGKPRDSLRKCNRGGKSSRKFHELCPLCPSHRKCCYGHLPHQNAAHARGRMGGTKPHYALVNAKLLLGKEIGRRRLRCRAEFWRLAGGRFSTPRPSDSVGANAE